MSTRGRFTPQTKQASGALPLWGIVIIIIAIQVQEQGGKIDNKESVVEKNVSLSNELVDSVR